MKGKICGKMCALGLSSFITQFALVIVIAVVNNTLKTTGGVSIYGEDIPVSAMGVVQKVSRILTSIVLGIATGILPAVSYNYGNKQYDRVKKFYKYAMIAGTVINKIEYTLQYLKNNQRYSEQTALYEREIPVG